MRPVAVTALVLALAAPHGALAQQPVPAPAPAEPATPPAPAAATAPARAPQAPRAPVPGAPPRPAPPPGTAPLVSVEPNQPGRLVNIQIDIVLTTEGGAQPPVRKTVTLTLADRQEGSVRSMDRTAAPQSGGSLNVDVRPVVQVNGLVLTRIGLEFSGTDDVPFVQVRAQPLLESGRALRISRAVSPRTDRAVTVEVTATVLK